MVEQSDVDTVALEVLRRIRAELLAGPHDSDDSGYFRETLGECGLLEQFDQLVARLAQDVLDGKDEARCREELLRETQELCDKAQQLREIKLALLDDLIVKIEQGEWPQR